ncbi:MULTISPECIES: exopolysaccharide biosynthesis protein [unclassified Roseovarius]|uniref:exopolysaccharide biosynthesis protein n=1 Tax=unclassified Roseovarius TaxID=2614913 RepID=UPI00273E3462|nr:MULTISPECIES: exopolysaccharide biosynthesis protein [unclassified Roseovarius]
MSEAMNTQRPVGKVIHQIARKAEAEKVRVGDLVEEFGRKSFLVLMLVPALLVASPLSGIPMLSTVCGLLIASIAGQMLADRDHVWMPARIMQLELSGAKMQKAARSLRWVSVILDSISRQRLHLLMMWPFRKLFQVLCIVCGAAMPFLEFVPFSSSILAVTVVLFTTALITQDGLLACVGLLFLGTVIIVPLVTVSIV